MRNIYVEQMWAVKMEMKDSFLQIKLDTFI